MEAAVPGPVLPDYEGACLANLAPALMGVDRDGPAAWLPPPVAGASQIVLFVLDGLGWEQLQERAELAPNLMAMEGGPITSVVPTTTATALTSISTGSAPALHGVVGYRVKVAGDRVMNVLRWRTAEGDALKRVPPRTFQPTEAFGGKGVPAVTRAEFARTGFTVAHLSGTRLVGWRMPSTLVTEVARLVDEGEDFVYAYYDGIDKVAHEWGLGPHFDAEVIAADRLVGDIGSALPQGATLVVTSDHGQVQVGQAVLQVDDEVMARVEYMSGEGRFRWLHARGGEASALAEEAAEAHRDSAWVHTREEIVSGGWMGAPMSPEVESRLGDVALICHADVAFADPDDPGELSLVSRHGSLTSAEMLVPLLATGA